MLSARLPVLTDRVQCKKTGSLSNVTVIHTSPNSLAPSVAARARFGPSCSGLKILGLISSPKGTGKDFRLWANFLQYDLEVSSQRCQSTADLPLKKAWSSTKWSNCKASQRARMPSIFTVCLELAALHTAKNIHYPQLSFRTDNLFLTSWDSVPIPWRFLSTVYIYTSFHNCTDRDLQNLYNTPSGLHYWEGWWTAELPPPSQQCSSQVKEARISLGDSLKKNPKPQT